MKCVKTIPTFSFFISVGSVASHFAFRQERLLGKDGLLLLEEEKEEKGTDKKNERNAVSS